MQVTITIPDKRIHAVLQGANVRYWADPIALTSPAEGCPTLTLLEQDTGETHSIGPSAIARGIALMGRSLGQLASELGWDADTGDALVQYACFGELRYG